MIISIDSFFFFLRFIYLFLFLVLLGFIAAHGFLWLQRAEASLLSGHVLSACGLQSLGLMGSTVQAQQL